MARRSKSTPLPSRSPRVPAARGRTRQAAAALGVLALTIGAWTARDRVADAGEGRDLEPVSPMTSTVPTTPPQDASAPIPAASALDLDGDGRVTTDEWLAWFVLADTNADGVVSRSEFAALKAGSTQGDRAPARGETVPRVLVHASSAGQEPLSVEANQRYTVLIFGSWT